MGSGLMDDVIWGLVSPKGVASERGLVGELPVTEGTLVDVWKVCLSVKGSQDRVVGPEGAIDAEVSTGKLWGLGHVFVSRVSGPVIVWSVVADNMFFKGDVGDKTVDAVGTLVIVWEACVEES
jgi:hypothetical protein